MSSTFSALLHEWTKVNKIEMKWALAKWKQMWTFFYDQPNLTAWMVFCVLKKSTTGPWNSVALIISKKSGFQVIFNRNIGYTSSILYFWLACKTGNRGYCNLYRSWDIFVSLGSSSRMLRHGNVPESEIFLGPLVCMIRSLCKLSEILIT